jgi:hypothetical protein
VYINEKTQVKYFVDTKYLEVILVLSSLQSSDFQSRFSMSKII